MSAVRTILVAHRGLYTDTIKGKGSWPALKTPMVAIDANEKILHATILSRSPWEGQGKGSW